LERYIQSTFDEQGRITSIIDRNPDGSVLDGKYQEYEYDSAGIKTTITRDATTGKILEKYIVK
jgi:hypothetical protein